MANQPHTFVVACSWRSDWNPNVAETSVLYVGEDWTAATQAYRDAVLRARACEEGDDSIKLVAWQDGRQVFVSRSWTRGQV